MTPSAKNQIRIVIADDHPIFRQGLRTILEANKNFIIAGDAADGIEVIAMIEKERPDVVILDVDMPGKNGVEVVEAFRDAKKPPTFIFLTMFKEKDLFDEAMELGVQGYVLKDSALTEIADCIRTVTTGKFYISPVLSTFVVQRSTTLRQFSKKNPAIEKLTPVEISILKFVGNNKTSKEIAAQMNISVRTVEHHRAHIAEKLQLKGSGALLTFALKHKGLL